MSSIGHTIITDPCVHLCRDLLIVRRDLGSGIYISCAMLKLIMAEKIKLWVTLIVFFGLSLVFADTIIRKEVFTDKYGFSIVTLGAVFLICEIFFNLGIALMLKGSGVLRIKLRDFLRFKFEGLEFRTRLFTLGFVINRIAAAAPWLYVLGVGWGKLPLTLSGLIVLELIVIMAISIFVTGLIEKHAYKAG